MEICRKASFVVHLSSYPVSGFKEMFEEVLAINISLEDFFGQPYYIGSKLGFTDLEGVGNKLPQNIGNYY
jgi:hypothetical protein